MLDTEEAFAEKSTSGACAISSVFFPCPLTLQRCVHAKLLSSSCHIAVANPPPSTGYYDHVTLIGALPVLQQHCSTQEVGDAGHLLPEKSIYFR